ncbi:MAG: bile acid:sodium symporter [Marinobacterium sp.]|nr:bile acid:sodium symporter [Marinobacterium sp.]
MKSAFLPAGLILAFIVAWLLPAPGQHLKELGLVPWVVVAIFVVNGYQTNLAELPRNRQFGVLVVIAAVINLLLAPLLGVAAAWLAGLSEGATLGLIVKTAVPSTLSTCIVLTQLAGGYGLWALILTLVLNVVGVFTLPFVLALALGQSSTLTVDPFALLQTLVQLVLIPFAIGALLRRLLSLNTQFLPEPQHPVLQYLPSSCVIAAVWMSLSSSSALFISLHWQSLLQITLVSVAVHLLLLAVSVLASRAVKLDWQARIALVFTAAQKTLPVAVSVLAALNSSVGEALLVCVLFHFLQLFIDSTLPGPVRRWSQAGQGVGHT